MKWIKHMTATTDDEKIARLIGDGGETGLARYGLYWRVQEIIGGQMEGKEPPCSVSYPVSVWSRLLFTRGSLVFSALSRLAVTHLVTVEREGNDIRVTNRNLLKYRDDYSKKSVHAPDNVPARTEEELKTEEEVDTPKPRAKAGPSAECVKLYAAYPRRIAPDAAYRAIAKALAKKPFADLLLAVERFATQCQRNATEPQFIPHPATWFNQGRYADDPQPDFVQSRGSQNVRTNPNIEALRLALVDEPDQDSAHPGGDDARSKTGRNHDQALFRTLGARAV